MKTYNIKLKRSEEMEKMLDFIAKEFAVTNKTALVHLTIGQTYQNLIKYKSQKYIKNINNGKPAGQPIKERLEGSILAREDQEKLCLQLPNGTVHGEVCEYSTYNEVTNKEYRVKRPLSALSQGFVDEVNDNEKQETAQ